MPPLQRTERAARRRLPAWGASVASLLLHLALGGAVILHGALASPQATAPGSPLRSDAPIEVLAEVTTQAEPSPEPAATPEPAAPAAEPEPAAQQAPARDNPQQPVRSAPNPVRPAAPAPPGSKPVADQATAEPASAAKPTNNPFVERLLAAEARKAQARAARTEPAWNAGPADAPTQPVPDASAAVAERPVVPTPAQSQSAVSPPAAPGAAAGHVVTRVIAAARDLAQASAWTIPYASATDPLWEQPQNGSGDVRVQITTKDGQIVDSQLLQGPAHLRKLVHSVLYYLQRNYRAPNAQEANGSHELQISARLSRSTPNLTLGYSADRPHSYFVLGSGRRFDFDVRLISARAP